MDPGVRLDPGTRLDPGVRLDPGIRLDPGVRLDPGIRVGGSGLGTLGAGDVGGEFTGPSSADKFDLNLKK